MKRLLIILFILVTGYTFFELLPYAIRTGGPCNAGVALIGTGAILVICNICLLGAIVSYSDRRLAAARIMASIGAVIWLIISAFNYPDGLTIDYLLFTPNLALSMVVVWAVFFKKGSKIK